MEWGRVVTGFILVVVGGINVVKPAIMVELQRWISQNIYGAEYKPSAKTYKVQKLLGIFFLIMGLSVLVWG